MEEKEDGGLKNNKIQTIADVGTDHGLLAMGLALSGRFDKVVGVDVSEQALQGAVSLLAQVKEHAVAIPVEFRLSNGLEKLQRGEADAICIAGMGVNTMLKILESSSPNNDGQELDLDRLECQKLLLQPTNSRPRNLIKIYDKLQQSGWSLVDERIEKLSSRWYISTCFVRGQSKHNIELPISKLADKMHTTNPILEEYVEHHLNWIQQDAKAGGRTNEREHRWSERFSS